MQCSGNADVGSNLVFDQPLEINLSLVPYSSLDIGFGGVNYWELGIQGSLEVSVAVSALLVAEASIDGKCSLNLGAIALPGFTILPLSVNPSIQPSVELSVSASAGASVGWVPVSGLQREWTIDTGVRYIGGSGWQTYRETDANSAPAQSPGFQAGARLELDLQASAGASAGLAFCLGTCWLTPEIGRIDFLSVQGGPYWRFAIETPLNPAHVAYAGPDMAIGVGASASAGIQASFFDSGILRYIPLSVNVGVDVEVFNEQFNFHQTPTLTGSVQCFPSCTGLANGGSVTLDAQLLADSSSSGIATFWVQPPGSDTLFQAGQALFAQQSAHAQFPLAGLEPGTWRIFARLSLDSPLFWFTEALPVASIQPIGQFSVSTSTPPPPAPGPGSYALTTGSYLETDDMDARCVQEFGAGAQLADWADIKAEYTGNAHALMAAIGMAPHSGSVWVQRNGNRWHTSTRHYLLSYHDGNVPPNYAVHDHIDNFTLSLGSWFGSLRALCRFDGPSSGGVGALLVPDASNLSPVETEFLAMMLAGGQHVAVLGPADVLSGQLMSGGISSLGCFSYGPQSVVSALNADVAAVVGQWINGGGTLVTNREACGGRLADLLGVGTAGSLSGWFPALRDSQFYTQVPLADPLYGGVQTYDGLPTDKTVSQWNASDFPFLVFRVDNSQSYTGRYGFQGALVAPVFLAEGFGTGWNVGSIGPRDRMWSIGQGRFVMLDALRWTFNQQTGNGGYIGLAGRQILENVGSGL